MEDVQSWLKKAESSPVAMQVVNFIFWRMIPFNRPHGITIESLRPDGAKVRLPYRKRNCNHLKGLHACALATAAEFSAGISLLQHVNPKQYRLIMKRIEVEYIAQGKKSALASTLVTEEVLTLISGTLARDGEVDVEMKVSVDDVSGKHLCVATVFWQLKNWNLVRTVNS